MPDAACSTPTETLTFNPTDANTAWYSVSSRAITVNTSDPSLAGNAAITVTSTLNDATSSANTAYTFTITFADPCAANTAPSNPATYTYLISTGPYTFTVPNWTFSNALCTYA